MTDAQKKLSDYFKKKRGGIIGVQESTKTVPTKAKVLIPYEIEKFQYIHEQLKEMLTEWEAYDEYDWQNIIAELLCLIFPKYIAVLKELEVKNFYSKSPDVVKRRIWVKWAAISPKSLLLKFEKGSETK